MCERSGDLWGGEQAIMKDVHMHKKNTMASVHLYIFMYFSHLKMQVFVKKTKMAKQYKIFNILTKKMQIQTTIQ